MTLAERIKQALAANNGGPGLTLDELCAAVMCTGVEARSTLSRLVFEERAVTCTRGPGADGSPGGEPAVNARYKLGDPVALIKVR